MQVDKLVQVGHSVRCTSMQLRLDELRLGSMRLLGNWCVCLKGVEVWEVEKLGRRCVDVFVVGKREGW